MFVNKGEHLYYMLFVKDEQKVAVVSNLTNKWLSNIKLFNPGQSYCIICTESLVRLKL